MTPLKSAAAGIAAFGPGIALVIPEKAGAAKTDRRFVEKISRTRG